MLQYGTSMLSDLSLRRSFAETVQSKKETEPEIEKVLFSNEN